MPLTSIIIPCFNEAKRLDPSEFTAFLKEHAAYHIVFVNDGSTDQTALIINDLITHHSQQVSMLTLKLNKGKAYAVREGFRVSLSSNNYNFIGYWDADLSTSLKELVRMSGIVVDHNLDFAFGSRMRKLHTTIKRSGFRHLAGRIITTLIDHYYKLGIYDTQCGAKLFSVAVADLISKDPFVTNWLFDVEIFLRINNYCPQAAGEEISLKEWKTREGSKINLLNAPEVFLEFIKLLRNYSNKKQVHG